MKKQKELMTSLTVFESYRLKKLCVEFEATSIIIDGVKITGLPLERWRKELDKYNQ